MRYSVLAPGKRLRPTLVIAGAEAVGGAAETVLDTACALELIHAYSLIHDDLPAMDDDDYRRGRLTNHKVFGEAMAILAGDALLTLAFRLVADNASRTADPRTVARVVADVADAAAPTAWWAVRSSTSSRRQGRRPRHAGVHPPPPDGGAHPRLAHGRGHALGRHPAQIDAVRRAGESLGSLPDRG